MLRRKVDCEWLFVILIRFNSDFVGRFRAQLHQNSPKCIFDSNLYRIKWIVWTLLSNQLELISKFKQFFYLNNTELMLFCSFRVLLYLRIGRWRCDKVLWSLKQIVKKSSNGLMFFCSFFAAHTRIIEWVVSFDAH